MSACLCVNNKSKKQSLMAISENDPRVWAGVVGTTGAKKRPRDLKNGSLSLTPPGSVPFVRLVWFSEEPNTDQSIH